MSEEIKEELLQALEGYLLKERLYRPGVPA